MFIRGFEPDEFIPVELTILWPTKSEITSSSNEQSGAIINTERGRMNRSTLAEQIDIDIPVVTSQA